MEHVDNRAALPLRLIEPINVFVKDWYRKNVGYLMAEEKDHDGQWVAEPQGTVFFMSERIDRFGEVYYAVTARHVIETIQSRGERYRGTFIRVNTAPDRTEDYPVKYVDWVCSRASDVAVHTIKFPDYTPFNVNAFPAILSSPPVKVAKSPTDGKFGSVQVGHDVFLVALFSPFPGRQGRVEAVVRFGRVASPETSLPVMVNVATEENVEAAVLLMEATTWGGESGSPVFYYRETWGIQGPSVREILRNPMLSESSHSIVPQSAPELLGLLHGHYPVKVPLLSGTDEPATMDLNSGIAIVIPTEDIYATLNDKRLVSERNRMIEKYKKRENDKSVPKPDIAQKHYHPFTKEDFAAALKKVSRRIQPSQFDEEK